MADAVFYGRKDLPAYVTALWRDDCDPEPAVIRLRNCVWQSDLADATLEQIAWPMDRIICA